MILIKLRIDRGLNQEEAAREIGISQSMLSALEQGYRSGSDTTKIKIARFYDQSVESIFLRMQSHIMIIERRTKMENLVIMKSKQALTTNIAESSNITQQKNSSSNISLHNLTVALKLTIQEFPLGKN